MRKFVVGLLGLLIVAGMGAPLVSGLVAEKIVRQSFGNLNTMYRDRGVDVSVEILGYHRGYRATEIEWRLNLGALKVLFGVDAIYFVDRADHGLTGIVSRTSLEKNRWYSEFVDQELGGNNPLSIVTEYPLVGSVRATLSVSPFALSLEGKTVTVKDGQLVFGYDREVKNIFSEMVWQGFAIDDRLQVTGVTTSSRLELISPYVWEGGVAIGVDHGRFADSRQPLEVRAFRNEYTVDVDREEQTLTMVDAVGAETVMVGTEKMENAFIRIGLVNIDLPAFDEFMKLYMGVANAVRKEAAEGAMSPPQMRATLRQELGKVQFQLLAAVEKLLKKNLEFQITDLHASLPAGEITGDLAVSLNRDITLAQFIPLVQHPRLALEYFALQSEVRFPAALAEDKPELLEPLLPGMKTGLVVRDGGFLAHRAETREGKLYLNDQEVVLP